MNIKEQVLSIHQVKELQELGFDVRKYATLAVIEAKDGNHYIVDRRLLSINMGFMETEVIEYFETLSIGDLMDILPSLICWDFALRIEKFTDDNINDYQTIYRENLRDETLYFTSEANLIDALFAMLKKCIQNNHIQCQ